MTTIGMWSGSRAAWAGGTTEEPDPLAGLPELAAGSRWVEAYAPSGIHAFPHVLHGEMECWAEPSWLEFGLEQDHHLLKDVRAVIARHDRERGLEVDGRSLYWRDAMRELAEELDLLDYDHACDMLLAAIERLPG